MWLQKEIIIRYKNKGFYLITGDIIQNFSELILQGDQAT